MNKTNLVLVMMLISLIYLTKSIHANNGCSCTCCLGNGCNPTYQGTFASSCNDCSNDCRKKYSECPVFGQPGKTESDCRFYSVSHAFQYKANMILAASFVFVCSLFKFNL